MVVRVYYIKVFNNSVDSVTYVRRYLLCREEELQLDSRLSVTLSYKKPFLPPLVGG